MLTLLKIDNEENVLVCLRIIIELHKQYRPEFNPEVCCFAKSWSSCELRANFVFPFDTDPGFFVIRQSDLFGSAETFDKNIRTANTDSSERPE